MSREMSPETDKKKRGGGLVSAIAYFTGVAVLVTGIALIAPDGSSDPVESAAADGSTTTTTTPSTSTLQVDAPSYVLGEEPIADAAEIILPSVVHIDTGGGVGAGVIYDSSGLIVTAAHVVGDNDTVGIRLDNGEQLAGTVLGAVSDVDIAVVQIEGDTFPAAAFNLEKPRVGQLAIAVGSPWGFESTVTAGIVSAVDQANCLFGNCFSMVQTDAAINPGNSGGPLVDRSGQVLGLNVSIITESGANDGVGFAVPASVVMEYANSIVTGEPIQAAFLGVSGQFASTESQAGALITEVFPGTGAASAGIQVGDVIVSLAGVGIQGIDDLQAQIRVHRPGDVVEVTVVRDGQELTLEVTLGVRSEDLS